MKIWHYITMALAFVAMVFRVLLSREKQKAAEEDAEREKSTRIAKDEATEALIRGITDENTTDNPRDYKF